METTLDRFGRIVIPKRVRENLGLAAGTVLRIEEVDGTVRLNPVLEDDVLVEKDGILVHRGRPTEPAGDPVKVDREARIRHLISPGRR